MSPGVHTERAFEDAVYELVQEQGWHPGPANWRPELGIDTGALLQFVGATQQQAWDDLIERYGGDQGMAQRSSTKRVAAEIDDAGRARRAAPRGEGPRASDRARLLPARPHPRRRRAEGVPTPTA